MWAYYGTAALCVVVGVTAESRTTRAAPMLLLLCIRLGAVITRLCINSGSHTAALHYLAMEVSKQQCMACVESTQQQSMAGYYAQRPQLGIGVQKSSV